MIGDYEIAAISDGTVPQALPPPGAYEIDPPHTFAYFDARHDVVGLVRGRFDKIAGTITVATFLVCAWVPRLIVVHPVAPPATPAVEVPLAGQ
jgi:hypothetical protein